MIKECSTSFQSLLLGLGILSYFIFGCNGFYIYNPFTTDFLRENVILYCITFYVTINVFIFFLYQGHEYQVAVRACFIGTVLGIGIIISVICSVSYKPFGFYLIILSFFHFSEYLTTAITNPTTLSLDSFLLNHSISYWVAAMCSWSEFFIERYYLTFLKEYWYITVVGVLLCIFGECMRKLSMITASENFNHVVQVQRKEGHQLVTWGVYSIARHPSYVGWFWWAIGTQVTLINPICMLAYAITSWTFFNGRIYFEELTLIKFFGSKYCDYIDKVGTGLPFIKGYKYEVD